MRLQGVFPHETTGLGLYDSTNGGWLRSGDRVASSLGGIAILVGGVAGPAGSEDGMADNDLPWFSTMGGEETTDGSGSEDGVSFGNLEFPGYQLLNLLGRGGMGEVYLARDLQLGRLVAIKTMLGSADPRRLERFTDEAKAIAKLSHANIAKVHAFGSVKGLPYLVMEYVGGGTVADLPADRLSDPRSAAELAMVVARAVAHAHELGIVHRDLKPSNLLLAEDKTSGDSGTREIRASSDRKTSRHPEWASRLRVADFGLAKQMGDSQQRTQTGEILGTPSYMAPEQASGVVHQIGPAVDVHAIGAILYECVTGRPPHLGSDSVQTLFLLLTTEPVSPRVLQPKLSRDLETIILKCLAKSPRARYASALALAADLERWLEGKPIEARRTSLPVRAARWVRRHPAVSSIAAIVVSSIVAIMVLQQWNAITLQRANDRAMLLLDVVNESIPQLDTLDSAERRVAEQTQWTIAADHLENLAAQVPSNDPMRFQAEQIRIKYLMGLVLNAELGANQAEERRLLDEADRSLDRLQSSNGTGIETIDFQLWGWRMISVHLDRLGSHRESIEMLEKALQAHSSFVEHHPSLSGSLIVPRIELLNSLGVSYSHLAERAHFEQEWERATELQSLSQAAFEERLELVMSEQAASLPNRQMLIADSAGNLGTLYGNQQRTEEAIAQLQIALEAYENLAQSDSSVALQMDLARTLNNLFVFRNSPVESMLPYRDDAERLRQVIDTIEPVVAYTPAAVDLAIVGNYFVAKYLSEQQEFEDALGYLDRGLRWCGYQLARSDSNEAILVLADTLVMLRTQILETESRLSQLPHLEVDEDDPVSESEMGFVLALTRLDEPLQTWLIKYRKKWSDPLSQQLAQRIETLAKALGNSPP